MTHAEEGERKGTGALIIRPSEQHQAHAKLSMVLEKGGTLPFLDCLLCRKVHINLPAQKALFVKNAFNSTHFPAGNDCTMKS